MAKLKRKYSHRTLKILFGLADNQCAHPDCTNTLIEGATNKSDHHVTTQISHIYAISEDGPRGKSGLTEKELNSHENLILLCRDHHSVVDGQYESYPADMLKEWKRAHELKVLERPLSDSKNFPPDFFSGKYFPIALVDQKIEYEINLIRKTRFFVEFDIMSSTLALAKRLVDGELSGGTDAVRSQALAWCARFLSLKKLEKAEEFLNLAKDLGSSPEIEIAGAFISSQKGDKSSALSALAGINSQLSRSASLMVVASLEGLQGAIDWLKAADIDVKDLDPDGKYILLKHHLLLSQWEVARETVDSLINTDLTEAPVLHHMVAITHLLSTVPKEFRAAVFNDIPFFDVANFPLAADAIAVESRRVAQGHFINASTVAMQLNLPRIAAKEDEYALWLELRDPVNSNKGKQKLEAKLRDPISHLRFVHLGFQFGIKLDPQAVEREIDRQIALNGGITADAAFARFSLAFTKKSPEDAANYVAQHCDDLFEHLDKNLIRFFQIEMFVRAGLPERAHECLDILVEEGIPEAEESRLQRIISEAEGTGIRLKLESNSSSKLTPCLIWQPSL